MPVPLPSKHRVLLRRYVRQPWTRAARLSPALRRYCDQHGYITPHFSWASYACTDGTPVPANLRANAIRLHWRLELLRHRLGDVPMRVDGPYRTAAHNRTVGGASDSRHIHADAADFYADQVDRWTRQGHKHSRAAVLALANQTFFNGGLGNENSGTLHVDTRGRKVRFITWTAAR